MPYNLTRHLLILYFSIMASQDTEGSSWHAFEAVDKVFLGGRDPGDAANPINNSFKTDFLFGCQVKETGLFVTQLADGIMGMSAHPSTLPKVMYDQEKLEHNMFSICFRRELHVSKRGILAGEHHFRTILCIETMPDFVTSYLLPLEMFTRHANSGRNRH